MRETPPATAGAPLVRRSRSAAETGNLGRALAGALATGDVVALSGPLGAGKTRFVAGVAEGIGIRSRIRSPSFTLVNEYRSERLILFHVDLYRLETGETAGLGLEEMLERGALVVEWGERLPPATRSEALAIRIVPLVGDERRLEAAGPRGRGRALLAAWARATADAADTAPGDA